MDADVYILDHLQAAVDQYELVEKLADHAYRLRLNGREFVIETGNRIKQYEESGTVTSLDEFVAQTLAVEVHHQHPAEYIRQHLVATLQPADLAMPEVVKRPFSGQTRLMLAFDTEIGIQFLSQDDLPRIAMDADGAFGLALRRNDALLAAAHPKEEKTQWGSYWWFDLPRSSMKASLLACPGLLEQVKALGVSDPVFIAPLRDSLYVLDAGDRELLMRVARVAMQDYGSKPYPISRELFGVRDGKVVAIGTFEPGSEPPEEAKP